MVADQSGWVGVRALIYTLSEMGSHSRVFKQRDDRMEFIL